MAPRRKTIRRRSKRTLQIALFTQDLGTYWEQAVQGIARRSRENAGSSIIMARFGEVTEVDVSKGLVDGVIIDQWANNQSLLARCRAARVPVVDISGDGDRVGVGIIAPDDRLVGKTVANYFLGRGFRNFGYYGLPPAIATVWDESRKIGFSEAVRTAGFNCAIFEGTAMDWGQMHQPQHLQALEKWIISLSRPTAILASIDAFAYEILRLALKAKIRVPDEMAVCGVDNRVWICTLANPTISSIPLDGQRAGNEAMDMLLGMIKSGSLESPPCYIEPLPIVHRESTDTYAFPDEAVVGALNFIRDNAHRHIGVEDILDHLLVSRRSLEVRFKKLTGVTLQNHIWFSHVERAKKLLLESAQPMYKICENSGFRSAAVFNVVFRRLVGTTPTNFRRRTRHGPL